MVTARMYAMVRVVPGTAQAQTAHTHPSERKDRTMIATDPIRDAVAPAHPVTVTSTEYERESLGEVVNLADGHARQPLTPTQQAIVDRFPELFAQAQRRSQFDLEAAFVRAFLDLADQPQVYPIDRYFLSYASSSAIGMVALYCRRQALTVALIEPVFDNIPNTLKAAGVPLRVLPEELLGAADLASAIAATGADVVWIVCPNNPTGFVLGEAAFAALVEACRDLGTTLVVDFCFRFFAPSLAAWDQYGRLRESSVSFVTIEDTGKTWATLDMKIGMLVCSDDLRDEFYHRHDDLLLNVSPFHLAILTEFIDDTIAHGVERTVGYFVQENRRILRGAFAGSVLRPANETPLAATVEWLRLDADLSGEELWDALRSRNIHILPGSNFFWHTPAKGRPFVRIPLARDPNLVSKAAPIVRAVATELAFGTA
jgi:aspartate/methionine/tyrosine aminotransferase